MHIINLTQHAATPEQIAAGVFDLQGRGLEALKELLTFETLPTTADVATRAEAIAVLSLASEWETMHAMIGGAPFLMGPLAAALAARGTRALFAFSKRESVETVQSDGSVKKTAVFRHAGFVGGGL